MLSLNPDVAHLTICNGNYSLNVCNAAFYTFINWHLNEIFLNFKHSHAIFKSTSYRSLWAKVDVCFREHLIS